MSIVVTGATGKLGGLVVRGLLRRGIAADQIVAAGRNRDRLDQLADLGVRIARIDLADPDSLRDAFHAAGRLLLISGSEPGSRVALHQNAITAAAEAGVGLVAYTSVARAGTTSLQLAADHEATEAALRRSGLPFVALRNGWYLENYTEQLSAYLEQGVVLGSAGDGLISAATRGDYADAAAAVLTSEGHQGAVYELGGDRAFTMSDLAAEITRQSNVTVGYKDLAAEAYADALVEVGLPEPVAAMLADNDRAVAAGELHVESGDLRRLIGRPTTSMPDAVRAALS